MKLYAPKDGVFAGVTFADGQADVHHEGAIHILKKFFGCRDTPFRQAKPAQAKPAQAKPATTEPAQAEDF